ncbi:hypothetical protein MKW98_001728 [Papaver atlanticum]|uniref:FBD domain-containing protein n=1 Tax=Papaver atlanticum TaxID=357466 RepID=A0AAD4S713_9MAGN|nr:hypothetical protein MKW98_001728 [Papaver atlanticum]
MVMFLRSDARKEREKDRISELPEPLIHHIFSFLFIKSIVSTSALSTKWRYTWTSTPIIDLCVCGTVEVIAFMRFVDRVLSFRQGVDSPPIKKFCLYSDYSFDQSRVYGWISSVLEHKVEELVLRGNTDIILPPCLFICESLTTLEISNGITFKVPESVNFTNLKILRLSVKLEDEHSIPKLLSNSPILEELGLDVLHGSVIQYLCIHSPNLKQLCIDGELHDLDVQMNAPNVQSLKICSTLAKDYVLHNFTALLDAEIFLSAETYLTLEEWEERFELGHLAIKLFASLSSVKCLQICDTCLMFLSHQDDLKTKLPLFYNLTHLEVTRNFYNGYYGMGKGPSQIVRVLLDFLHISPNVESLVFDEGIVSDINDCWSVDLIPQCLLLHLKSIEFCGLFWYQFEKDLVRFFLKNVKALQRVRITIAENSEVAENSNYKKIILDEISLFPRGSADCLPHVSLDLFW